MRSEAATRRVDSFGKRFGRSPSHLYLAYHAAFPLALTPDLLYRIWANFQRDIHGKLLNIPWIAVADLLLSNLCDEVGHELYEMDNAVRNELLRRLKEEPQFGEKRINELSDFLLAYVRKDLNSSESYKRDFAQSQRWTALAYKDSEQAARELALAFNEAYQQDNSELVRLAALTETLEQPLKEFEKLLIYARAMGHYTRKKLDAALNESSKLVVLEDRIEVARVNLSIPETLLREIRRIQHQLQLQDEQASLEIPSAASKTHGKRDPEKADNIPSANTFIVQFPELEMADCLAQLQPSDQIYSLPIDMGSLKNETDTSVICQELCNQIFCQALLDAEIPNASNFADLKRCMLTARRLLQKRYLALILHGGEPDDALLACCRKLCDRNLGFHVVWITDAPLDPPLRGFPPHQANLIGAIQSWLDELG